jgi:H+/Cl- antiporter ClcA
MNNIKIILSVILGGFAVLFIIQNFAVISIRFLFWTLSISSSLLMFLLLLIGFILGWLLHNYFIHSRKKLMKKD